MVHARGPFRAAERRTPTGTMISGLAQMRTFLAAQPARCPGAIRPRPGRSRNPPFGPVATCADFGAARRVSAGMWAAHAAVTGFAPRPPRILPAPAAIRPGAPRPAGDRMTARRLLCLMAVGLAAGRGHRAIGDRGTATRERRRRPRARGHDRAVRLDQSVRRIQRAALHRLHEHLSDARPVRQALQDHGRLGEELEDLARTG